MALTQVFTVITLFCLFRPLYARFSNRTIVMMGATGWVILTVFFPLASFVARQGQSNEKIQWLLYPLLGMWVLGRPMGLLWWT
jgi:hypothetical protein